MDQSQQQPGQTSAAGDGPERYGSPSAGQDRTDDQNRNGKRPDKGRTHKEIVEWIKALAIAGILVFVIRWFLFSPFIVDGESMMPNFETGERLIVNKIIYDIRPPKRGEIVVFYVPDENRDFIKRVIALPGDKVRYEGDNLYINGNKVEEPYIRKAIEEANKNGGVYNSFLGFPNSNVTEDTVPAGTILAFGDNRGNSKDSRVIGFVPYDQIVGRADIIFWPLDKLKFVKHG